MLYEGPLGSPVGLDVVGNSAVGAQPGDRVLGAGSSEVLCTRTTLPAHTGIDAAGRILRSEQLTVNTEPTD